MRELADAESQRPEAMQPDALLSHPQVGSSWEGMVIEEILRQLNAVKSSKVQMAWHNPGKPTKESG